MHSFQNKVGISNWWGGVVRGVVVIVEHLVMSCQTCQLLGFPYCGCCCGSSFSFDPVAQAVVEFDIENLEVCLLRCQVGS